MGLIRGPGFDGCSASWADRRDRGETPDPYPITQVGAAPRSRHLLNSDGGSIPDSRLLAMRGEYTSLCVHALVHHPDRGVGMVLKKEERALGGEKLPSLLMSHS